MAHHDLQRRAEDLSRRGGLATIAWDRWQAAVGGDHDWNEAVIRYGSLQLTGASSALDLPACLPLTGRRHLVLCYPTEWQPHLPMYLTGLLVRWQAATKRSLRCVALVPEDTKQAPLLNVGLSCIRVSASQGLAAASRKLEPILNEQRVLLAGSFATGEPNPGETRLDAALARSLADTIARMDDRTSAIVAVRLHQQSDRLGLLSAFESMPSVELIHPTGDSGTPDRWTSSSSLHVRKQEGVACFLSLDTDPLNADILRRALDSIR